MAEVSVHLITAGPIAKNLKAETTAILSAKCTVHQHFAFSV